MTYFFKAVSYIFHPFLMPLTGLFALFSIETLPASMYKLDALYHFPTQAKEVLYVVFAILTLLAPGLSLLIMYWNKMVTSLELEDRKERVYPFVLVTFYYILAYWYLKMQVPPFLQHPALMSFVFGIILTFVVAFVVNFFVKISLHAAAAFGVCGLLLAYFQTQIQSDISWVLIFLLLAGLVAASRVYLKAHSLSETLIGMLVGFGVIYTSVYFSIYI